MSANQFAAIVASLGLSKNAQTWFPIWIFKFASSLNASRDKTLNVTEQKVIDFSRNLRDDQVPAWKRQQAVKAIDCYRTSILQSAEPCLDHILFKLRQVATAERNCRLCFSCMSKFYGRKHRSMTCLLYTSPSPRDATLSRMPSSA